jgi:hypothetical protein
MMALGRRRRSTGRGRARVGARTSSSGTPHTRHLVGTRKFVSEPGHVPARAKARKTGVQPGLRRVVQHARDPLEIEPSAPAGGPASALPTPRAPRRIDAAASESASSARRGYRKRSRGYDAATKRNATQPACRGKRSSRALREANVSALVGDDVRVKAADLVGGRTLVEAAHRIAAQQIEAM